jgi:hypothetical protein
MQLLSIPHLSLWVSIAAIVILFALLLAVRARRKRQEDDIQPEIAQVVAHELGRIADALERLSSPQETQPSELPPLGAEKTSRRISMSLFGR